jgi:hypothetical protein
MDKVIAWWKSIVLKMNEQGIPIPMVRVNGAASVTGTMVIVSFFLCMVPSIMMIATVIAKLGGFFEITKANEDQLMNAFSASIQLLIASLGGYLGRGMQRGADGKVILEKEDKAP